MSTMNISLPDDMKDWVDAQVRARGFMSASEFIRDLIRQQREEIETLREKILAGMESGPPIPAEEVMQRLRQRILDHPS